MFSKILMATDGSEPALKAAQYAAKLAKKFSSQITIIHVVSIFPGLITFPEVPTVPVPNLVFLEELEKLGRQALKKTKKIFEESNIEVETKLERGHPAETICRVAKAGNYDLIVMGNRGLSEVKGFLLGSVSDRVSHHATCPVLIIR